VVFSNYLEDGITGWINGTTFDPAPTSTFVQLYSQDPTEAGSPTGALYTRVAVAAGGWTRGTNGGGALTNTNVITITSSAPSGATATHVAVFDSSTGGNMLFYGLLTAPKVIAAGNEVKFNASTLVLIVSVSGNLLLDLYPNAAAAYSLRKLRTAYAGSAIRVRRSSDNTEQDIGFDVNGNLDTVALLAFCGVGNGFVTTWYDQSGNARNVTQTTAAAQPLIYNNGNINTNNGKPSVYFDGSNDVLALNSFTVLSVVSNFTVVIATKVITPTNSKFIFNVALASTNNRVNLTSDGRYTILSSTTFGKSISISSNSNNLFFVENIPQNLYKNNVLATGTLSNTGGNDSRFTIGGIFTSTTLNAEIDLQEFIVYPVNQNTNRDNIQNNINTYYAMLFAASLNGGASLNASALVSKLPSSSLTGAGTLAAALTVVGAFDGDAQAFFDRVTVSGGTLTTTEQMAVNTLVIGMKADGIWTKMKAIYPMVGASAAACAQNLKSSSFTGTFSSGWTFASTGVTPNGTSAFMNTFYTPSVNGLLNSAHLSYYSRTNQNLLRCMIGSYENLSGDVRRHYFGQSSSFSALNSFAEGNYAPVDYFGHHLIKRENSTETKQLRNGIVINPSNIVSTNRSSVPIYIAAVNYSNTNTLYYSTLQCAFSSIGDGLTDTEAANFYTRVQAFQTTLNRQV